MMKLKYIFILLFVGTYTQLTSQNRCYILMNFSSCHQCLDDITDYLDLKSTLELKFIVQEFYKDSKDSIYQKRFKDKIDIHDIIYSDSIYGNINKYFESSIFLFNKDSVIYSNPICLYNSKEIVSIVKSMSFSKVTHKNVILPPELAFAIYNRTFYFNTELFVINESNNELVSFVPIEPIEKFHHFKISTKLEYHLFNQSALKKYFDNYEDFKTNYLLSYKKDNSYSKLISFKSVFCDSNYIYLLTQLYVNLPKKNKNYFEYFICKYSIESKEYLEVKKINNKLLFEIDPENAFYVKDDHLYLSVINNIKDSKKNVAIYRNGRNAYHRVRFLRFDKPKFLKSYNLSTKVYENGNLYFQSVPIFFDTRTNKEFVFKMLNDLNNCTDLSELISKRCSNTFVSSVYGNKYIYSLIYYYKNKLYVAYFSKDHNFLNQYNIPIKNSKFGSRAILVNENQFFYINSLNNSIELYTIK